MSFAVDATDGISSFFSRRSKHGRLTRREDLGCTAYTLDSFLPQSLLQRDEVGLLDLVLEQFEPRWIERGSLEAEKVMYRLL
jgi:hypothetical protein